MRTTPTAALPSPPSYKFLFDSIGLQERHTEADSLGRAGWGGVGLLEGTVSRQRHLSGTGTPTHRAYTTYHEWRSQ